MYSLLGCLPKAITGNFLIGIFFLLLSILLGGPKIYIELPEAVIAFCFLLVLYIALTWWSIWTLAKGRARNNLVIEGPYRFVRNPMYSAIIFILNPALGILFRSWPLLLSSILIYFLWKKCIIKEEKCLEEKFGQAYRDYRLKVGCFFPRIWQINKPIFYSLLAISIFSTTFVLLNFSSFYLRWTAWEKKGEIVYDQSFTQPLDSFSRDNEPANTDEPKFDSFSVLPLSPKANYNASPNSISISKIGINAPIVSADGTKQSQLNAALDQGVVLYPGSPLPGQSGEVALTGHSSVFPWNKTSYGQVFALLDKVEKGDVISVVYDNYQYDYQVTDKNVLLPSQVKTSPTMEHKLIISTCWPIGTALKRLVVYADLIK